MKPICILIYPSTSRYIFDPRWKEGLAWIESYEGVEALFVVRNENGTMSVRMSSGFAETTRLERVPEPTTPS